MTLAKAVLAQGDHALLQRLGPQRGGRLALGDQVGDGRGNQADLVERRPAGVTGLAAVLAARRMEDGGGALRGKADLPQVCLWRRGGRLAARAEKPHQPLSDKGSYRGADQERLHPHVDQSGDPADGVVGVQGAEDQVAGQRSPDGDLRGFEVAHFPHHDYVRVAAQNAAQSGGEAQPDLGPDGNLDDAVQFMLHRLLDGDDAALLGVEVGKEGVEGGRLAAAGRAGEQDDAVGHGQEVADALLGRAVQAQARKIEALLAQQPEAHALPGHRGDGGYPDVDGPPLQLQVDAPVLGQAPLRNVQVGHDLKSREYRGLQHLDLGGDWHLMEDAVDAVTDLKVILQRFDMDVGGSFLQRLAEDLVHEFNH